MYSRVDLFLLVGCGLGRAEEAVTPFSAAAESAVSGLVSSGGAAVCFKALVLITTGCTTILALSFYMVYICRPSGKNYGSPCTNDLCVSWCFVCRAFISTDKVCIYMKEYASDQSRILVANLS